MVIRFGLLTNPRNEVLGEIKLIEKLGFDYVELGIELPGGAAEILLREKIKILNLLKNFKHPTIAHTAWWIDFGSGYEYIRQAWIEEAKRSIDTSKSLGIKLINFHFYSIGLVESYKSHHKFILETLVKSLKEIVSYASSKGITVMYENSPTKKSIVGIKEYKFILDKTRKLKVHLDIAHAFVENGMEGIKDYIFTFKDRIEHMHIHDNSGEGDEHLPLGDGRIDFEQVAKWLKKINYNKTMTFEVFTSKEDAKDSMLRFKKILSSI